MRRLVLLLCAISLVCLPIPMIHAATDAGKPAQPAAKPEPPAAKPEKPRHHHQKKAKEKDADQQKAKAEKDKTAATDKSAKPAAKPTTPAEKKPAKKPVVVLLTLKGEYPERAAAPGLFGELQPSLANLVQRMDAAAADKDVAAVWLKIESPAIGRGKICELRAAIARLRKAKKPVYAELTTASTGHYLLAAACEQIIMPPSGMLLIPGVRMEVSFYKGLLDKLGLQFDVLQMGKYKGAAEPLTRNEMSKPLRESLDAIVNNLYDELVATIGADRKMKDYKVKTLLDQGLFTATAAKKAGLVDELLYADQLRDAIKKALKADDVEIVTNYKKKRIDTDFSGISGMMKLFELMMGAKPSEAVSKKQKIAVVYAVGPIMEGKSKTDIYGGESAVGSTTIVEALRKAADDAKVAAIVLRIDSPGGSAVASDLIWRETVRIQAKKPVIASMSDVAGSGGYYIAMGAKKIIAAPGTITGSIGVIGGKLVTRGLCDKIGLNTEVISRGANAGSLSSTHPFTPEERKAWTELLEETYHQFVGKAAEGRKMPYDKLQEMAQGRVYTGRMAKNLGLIDDLGTLDDAVVAAKTAAGLKADVEVDLMILPEPKSFFEQLFGDASASTDLESLLPEGFRVLRQTATLRQLLSERMLLWMPYSVEVK
jgi:protease IV